MGDPNQRAARGLADRMSKKKRAMKIKSDTGGRPQAGKSGPSNAGGRLLRRDPQRRPLNEYGGPMGGVQGGPARGQSYAPGMSPGSQRWRGGMSTSSMPGYANRNPRSQQPSPFGGQGQMPGQYQTGGRPPAGGMQGGGYPPTNWWQNQQGPSQSQWNAPSSQFNYGGGYAPSGGQMQSPPWGGGQMGGRQPFGGGPPMGGMPSYQPGSYQNTAYPELQQRMWQQQMMNNMPGAIRQQYQMGNAMGNMGIGQNQFQDPNSAFYGYGNVWGPTGPGQYTTGGQNMNWNAMGGQQTPPQQPYHGGMTGGMGGRGPMGDIRNRRMGR